MSKWLTDPTENLPLEDDPFDSSDAEDEADRRERDLERGEGADDADEGVRRELGLEQDGDFS